MTAGDGSADERYFTFIPHRFTILFEVMGVAEQRTTRISTKNQITIPVYLLRKARLRPGDQVQLELDETGRMVLTAKRPKPDLKKFIGVWKGHTPYQTGTDVVEDLRGPCPS